MEEIGQAVLFRRGARVDSILAMVSKRVVVVAGVVVRRMCDGERRRVWLFLGNWRTPGRRRRKSVFPRGRQEDPSKGPRDPSGLPITWRREQYARIPARRRRWQQKQQKHQQQQQT